ncbi:hypothetical protein [Enterococcus sp. LJL90]
MKSVKVLIDLNGGNILCMTNDDSILKTAMIQALIDIDCEFEPDFYERKNWGEYDLEIYEYFPTTQDDIVLKVS